MIVCIPLKLMENGYVEVEAKISILKGGWHKLQHLKHSTKEQLFFFYSLSHLLTFAKDFNRIYFREFKSYTNDQAIKKHLFD